MVIGITGRIRGGKRRAVLAGAFTMTVATVALTVPLAAVPAWAQQQAALMASITALRSAHSFDIPAQPLADALVAFGRQSGIQVTVDGRLARGVSSPGVRGAMTSDQALDRLLAGSNLTYVMANATTVAIERRAQQNADGSIQLGPVIVEGESQSESAYGPVEGYVAKRSATGTKTDVPISEVPQSISVITRDQIDARGARTLTDALMYTAGVRTGARGESGIVGGDDIIIRGFGGTGSANEYWDGLRILGTNFAVSGIEPYLFERVEVLRGPASVLYGQGQPGGVVNSVSKRPPKEFQGGAQVLVGSFDTREANFEIGGPLTSNKDLSFLLIGVLSDQNGQTDFTGQERKFISPSLLWEPSAQTSLNVQFVYQKDDGTGGNIKYVPAVGTLFPNPNGKIPRTLFTGDPNFEKWDRELLSIGYVFDHAFNDSWSVRQNARYLHTSLDMETIYGILLQPDDRTLSRTAFAVKEQSNTFAIDNQLVGTFTTGALTHELLFGVDGRYRKSKTLRRFASAFSPTFAPPTLDIFAPVYFQTIPEPPIQFDIEDWQYQIGVYLQNQVRFQNWILTLSGRYDWAETELNEVRLNITEKTKDSAFTGRAGLGYVFPNGITAYVSFSQSFDPQDGLNFNGDAFDPLKGEQYEAGIKYDVPGRDAFLTLAVFELSQKNVLTTDPDNPGFSVQTGEVRSRGVELEALASLDSGWDIVASYTYLDQEVTKSNDDNLGKRLTGIPKHEASLWVDYTFDHNWLRGLEIGAGVRYVGSSAGDRLNTFDVPSYTLFDASLNYDMSSLHDGLSGWKVAVNATNLTDKTYIASCISLNTCYFGIGRSVIGRLQYRW